MSTGTRPPASRRVGLRERQRPPRQRRQGVDEMMPRSRFATGRFRIVILLLVLAALTVLAKLFYIQLIDAGALRKKAQQSRNQALSLYNRGRILDRNGVILAQDTVLYDLFIHPAYFYGIPRDTIAAALAPALNRPELDIIHKLREPYGTIGVQKNLTHADMLRIAAIRIPRIARDPKTHKLILNEAGHPVTRPVPLPGLDFVRKNVRNYPQGSLAAHVLGYVNDEAGVSSGVEASAAQILKKRPLDLNGTVLDGHGNLVALDVLDPRQLVTLPKAADVGLTLDARLQYVAERELAIGLAKSHAQRGTVIMLDPRTGELLAFAVQPGYQPDEFYKTPPEDLKNWAVTDVYPPGSTFKILTVAAGLETGVINKNTRILDTGKMKIGGWTIQNYDYNKHGAPGMIDLVYLLMHSSNIASAKISLMIPIPAHHDVLQRIGIGSKTGVDLPGESKGILLPQSAWDESTHASIGYGYGMAATPLQIASAVAAIANGGVWNSLHIIRGTAVTHRRLFSEKTCTDMRDLLTKSIQDAASSTVRLETVAVAGKTGTSRKPNPNGHGYSPNVFTSFVGFFPAQAPRVLVMVVVDSPHMAEAWGSTVAGPIFHNIAEETVSYLGLNPAKIRMGMLSPIDRVHAGSTQAPHPVVPFPTGNATPMSPPISHPAGLNTRT